MASASTCSGLRKTMLAFGDAGTRTHCKGCRGSRRSSRRREHEAQHFASIPDRSRGRTSGQHVGHQAPDVTGCLRRRGPAAQAVRERDGRRGAAGAPARRGACPGCLHPDGRRIRDRPTTGAQQSLGSGHEEAAAARHPHRPGSRRRKEAAGRVTRAHVEGGGGRRTSRHQTARPAPMAAAPAPASA